MKPDKGILHAYSAAYESLTGLCARRWFSADAALLCVEAAATFASTHHPGRVGDGTIENVAFAIGSRLHDVPSARPQRPPRYASRKRRILHVSPFLWRVGGHTRTLQNWIRQDRESQHSVALTHSMDPMLFADMQNELERSGGELVVLPSQHGPLDKARELRAIARHGADLIVLHHTCNDVVPTVAFAAKDLPPVALVNDCDQAFWLGCSVADLIVNQREAGARLSRERRAAKRNAVLPIPLFEAPPEVSRDEARRELGIPADALVLLTVGRAVKYRPSGSHDFFRTVRSVLETENRAHLFVVGLGEEEALRWKLDFTHPRIHLCGARSDLDRYWASADLYLESMPFGSATALMEAAYAGLPAVLPFAPPLDLFVTNHGLESVLQNPATERDYVAEVIDLLRDGVRRRALAEALVAHIKAHHTGEGWRHRLESLYAVTDTLKHDPRFVPATRCTDSVLDRALSDWQAFLNETRAEGAERTTASAVREIVLEIASRARERGDYRDAAEILVHYVLTFGLDRHSARLSMSLSVRKARHLWHSTVAR